MKFALRHRLGWLWGFAVAVVLAQALGAMHSVVHVRPFVAQPAHHHQHDGESDAGSHGAYQQGAGEASGEEALPGRLHPLFSLHDDQTDCRLYDQAGHDVLAWQSVVPSLPAVLSACLIDIPRGEAMARWAAQFQARGPPIS